jgi:L-lactate dehydrogenase complex protein LldG
VDDRDVVLSALPVSPGGEKPSADISVLTVPKGSLWECFVERLTALGGEVKSLEDLAEFSGRAFCDEDVPSFVQESLGEPVQSVWVAEAGVTLCELAVAETGSLLVSARSGRSRLASLAPPVHVALLRQSSLVASLEEGIARAPAETSFLVSGPSRTADVEGVMVMGVHGPKRLWVVPLPE